MAESPLPFNVQDFWQWMGSDLLSNALRGTLAEYLVAQAVGVADGMRTEWDAVDLKTPTGLKVEVKSAAYVQSWHQKQDSTIVFGIDRKRGWDAETSSLGAERQRSADVYVFALLHHRERATVDPLDLAQWTFFVLPTAAINQRCPTQKQISLATLKALGPREVPSSGLKEAIEVPASRMPP